MNRYLILVCGWAVYFFLHSFFAADSVKKYLKSIEGMEKLYRIIYVMFSSSALVWLIYINLSIKSEMIIESLAARNAGYVLVITGILIILQSFQYYSLKAFLGISREKKKLKIKGILKHVRHPIYLGTILIIIGVWLIRPDYPTLVSGVMNLFYLAIGVRLEERKLIKEFGGAYKKYKRKVPMIIPRFE